MLLQAFGGLAQPTAIAVVRGDPSECGECAEVLSALDHARTDMRLHYSAIEAAYINSKKFPKVAEQLIRAAKRDEQEEEEGGGKKEGGGNATPMRELAQVFIVYAVCLGGCVHARMLVSDVTTIAMYCFHSLALCVRQWFLLVFSCASSYPSALLGGRAARVFSQDRHLSSFLPGLVVRCAFFVSPPTVRLHF